MPIFFFQFVRVPGDVALELQLPYVVSKRFDLSLQRLTFMIRRRPPLAPHKCWALSTESLFL